MSFSYPPGSRPGRQNAGRRATASSPTLEDYNAIVQAYKELKSAAESQVKLLNEASEALAVRDDALHRQGEDLQQTRAEAEFMKAALQQAQREMDEKKQGAGQEDWQERYLRLQAEMENLRRRIEQRAAMDTGEARRTILRDMLPLADHLEMALQHGAALEGETARNFVGSIEATVRAFNETLRRYGVVPIDVQGALFNPQLHEAVGQVPTGDIAPGHIAHVVQRGYMDGDHLLRPARVLVRGQA